ncbi:hypothetical protein RCC89_13795 [Cytophagaceae bacterium ABcell3]|nr:hypothetical protein RCC89_13795 [Cytophagaceae bacterium ABcell3]
MTALHATPDLDHLEPTSNSETKRRRPCELVELIEDSKNLCKGGSLRLYGSWFGKHYDNCHKIETAHYYKRLNIVTLNFKGGLNLKVYNPEHIFEASTFLKVVHADRVKLSWINDKKNINPRNYYIDYTRKNNKIRTETNLSCRKPTCDISLNAPALIIYN